MSGAIDHAAIKTLGKALGRPASTLVALSPQNDPFYIAPYRRNEAEWFAGVWRDFGFGTGTHIRRIHYRIVSQPKPLKMWSMPYTNTKECWEALCKASQSARYLGLVSIEEFVDQRSGKVVTYLEPGNAASLIVAFSSPLGALPPGLPHLPQLMMLPENEPRVAQRHQIEIWCEKSTIDDVIRPLGRRYSANVFTSASGEISLTRCLDLVLRAQDSGRPVRIIYISDFDPAGQSMPVAAARKIEWLIRDRAPELDVQVRPIALTFEQCQHYRLPRAPMKETERRAARFEERFGSGATELDAIEALHPGELGRIIEKEIKRYHDTTLQPRTEQAIIELRDEIGEINERAHAAHREDVDALREEYEDIAARMTAWRERADSVWRTISKDIEAEAPDLDKVEWPEPAPGDEDPDPLFDSTRDYVEQIDRFKLHQDKPIARVKRGTGTKEAAPRAARTAPLGRSPDKPERRNRRQRPPRSLLATLQ